MNAIGIRHNGHKRQSWYVESLPGDGGVDWGYTTKVDQAIPLSPYWQKRFRANCRAVGVSCSFVPVDALRVPNPLSRVKVGSPSMLTGEAPTKRLRKRRAKTEQLPAGYYANPLSRVKVGSPSQRPSLLVVSEHGDPSPRLKKRRAKTAALKRPGAYANPVESLYPAGGRENPYRVEYKNPGAKIWLYVGSFVNKGLAEQYARAYFAAHPTKAVRVVSSRQPAFSSKGIALAQYE